MVDFKFLTKVTPFTGTRTSRPAASGRDRAEGEQALEACFARLAGERLRPSEQINVGLKGEILIESQIISAVGQTSSARRDFAGLGCLS